MPACRNCVNRGIVCPGYRQVLRWSTKYEHPASKPAADRRSGKGPAGEAKSIPEFSLLASAASQSIEPAVSGSTDGASPSSSASPASTATKAPASPPASSSNTSITFEPVMVKTEPASIPRQPLPPEPLLQTQPIAVSSYSPAASSTSSSSTASYTQHATPVVPVLAASAQDVTSDQFAFTNTPTETAPAEVSSPRQDWQVALFGDQEAENEQEEELSFMLESWQPKQSQYYGWQPQPYRQQQLQVARPTRGLALPDISLVELWFKSVCGMWAAFDSPSNPFRRLCSRLWTSNEAVFFSMQTMAAASLPRRPPSVSEIVAVAPKMSTQALIQELQELFDSSDGPTSHPGGRTYPQASSGSFGSRQGGQLTFPAGLLTALFCMSSSLSWIDARQLGIQYLRNARSVIDLLDLRAAQLSAEDRELLEFFRGCLLYEEMLRSVVTDDEEDIQALLDWSPYQKGDGKKVNLDLHAWAGVPIVLVGLFGKVMALCRRSRKAWRSTGRATYQLLYQAMQDIQQGQALEELLLTIDIPLSRRDPSGGKRDTLTTHIYKAAEAFRLSSLLQLYQTFPDLVSRQQQVHGQFPPVGAVATVSGRSLIPLALHITELLGEIPADSPMRCLQPLLCLCAGSALRVEASQNESAEEVDTSSAGSIFLSDALGGRSSDATSVYAARDALRVRLGKLEQNLPPRPITVAKQLLETVWLTYDTEAPPSRSHWLDIMSETSFESVFG
ncbi:hypothetical protein SEPCBS57363_004397 [Sporothrix epigloea]|uniref:Zn(2)-C6 fungal-type domain-containing protein n=1 Tax=Sporothrix epigloea TaxID=1892477 RepID=A0ABP0DRT9_9PEZI